MTDAARLLRYARKRAGLTQRELAAKAGVPQSYVARIETSKVDPTVSSLSRLLRACETTLEAMPGSGDVDRTMFTLRLTPAERLVMAVEHARGLAEWDAAMGRPVTAYDPVPALRALAMAGVAFVLIGRLAGVLRGSAVVCSDLVICPERSADPAPGGDAVEVVRRPPGTAGYSDLAAGADVLDLGGFRVTVAALDDLIRIGRASARNENLIEVEILLGLRDETMRE